MRINLNKLRSKKYFHPYNLFQNVEVNFFLPNLLLLISYYLYHWTHITPFFNIYDSPSYFHFSLWNNFRGVFITLPYSLIGDYHSIALFQNLVGAFSWALAATVLGSRFNSLATRVFFQFSISVVAMSTPIYEHNNVMMSESLGISALVVFFTFYIRFIKSKQASDLKLVFLALIWLSGTKQSYSLISPVIYVITLFFYKRSSIKLSRPFLLCSGLVIIWAFLMNFSTHTVSDYNLVALIYYRFSYVSDWQSWWANTGFPSKLLMEKDFQVVLQSSLTKNWLNNTSNVELINFYGNFPLLAIFGVFLLPLFSNSFDWGNTGLGAMFGGTRLTFQNKLDAHQNLFGIWPKDYFYSTSNLKTLLAIFFLGFALVFILYLRNIKFTFWKYAPIVMIFIGLLEVNFLLAPFDFSRIFIAQGAVIRIFIIYFFFIAIEKNCRTD